MRSEGINGMAETDQINAEADYQLNASLNKPDGEADFFTNLFIHSPIGTYIVQDGIFKFVNPEFLRIGGYREEELLGRESAIIVFPVDRDMVRKNAVGMLKGHCSSPYVYRAVTKQGEIRWIIETVTSISYGGKKATLGYFMNNTENERAKEALRISEDKFHKAFRSSPDWVVISTLEDGFYIDVNEAFLRATCYSRAEIVGNTSLQLGIWADPHHRAEMVEILREKGVVRNFEARFRMKSGEIRYVLWSAEVIDHGDEKCLIAVTRDITARKRAEEERLKREKLQGVLEMAGAACHELNQPLQYICLLLNELLEEYPESTCVQEMKKQFDRIKEITHKVENITIYERTDYIKGSKIIDIDKASKKC